MLSLQDTGRRPSFSRRWRRRRRPRTMTRLRANPSSSRPGDALSRSSRLRACLMDGLRSEMKKLCGRMSDA
eukprot:760612-Hanusia_phi.AAC.3